jgi:hypothetical protein
LVGYLRIDAHQHSVAVHAITQFAGSVNHCQKVETVHPDGDAQAQRYPPAPHYGGNRQGLRLVISLLRGVQHAVIVAMAAMMVVQVAIHQVVYVVPVRYCLMAAVWSVNVFLPVSDTFVGRRALLGIRRAHLNPMILHMSAVLMVEMAIVQIIRVTVVLYSLMAAIWTMRMGMGA